MTLKHALLATVILTAAAPAVAQTTPPKPDVPAPRADPGIVAQPKLGVVQTPKSDPGMTIAPPQTGTGTVIPPPGTPHNNPALVPK
jgi:hypothetical protein